MDSVTIPYEEDGSFLYEVDATPKPDSDKKAETTTTAKTTKPSGERLPRTGQLKWPIAILTAVGAVLIGVGILLTLSDNNRKKEATYDE